MFWSVIVGFVLGVGIFFICPYFKQKSKLLSYVENDKYFYIIVYFLLKEKAYNNFIGNLKNKDLYLWYRTYFDSYIFSEAFDWNETKQGYDYWFNLNKKWLDTYQKLYRELSKENVIKFIKLEYRKL